MRTKKLVNAIDDSSVELAQLATLLEAQANELESIDNNDNYTTLDNWRNYQNQIEVINNIVFRHLKATSDKFTDLVDNYNIQNAKRH